ncbi:hypothetical protein HDU76_006958, partial [Blyttiomyces sp. JEL0837]
SDRIRVADEYTDNFTKPTKPDPVRWIGYDSSIYNTAKTKIILEMMKSRNARLEHIIQVWYSSTWSYLTSQQFHSTTRFITQSRPIEEFYDDPVMQLICHWRDAARVPVHYARGCWNQNNHRPDTWIANFNRELDIAALCWYVVSGDVYPNVDDLEVFTGNKTFYCIPPHIAISCLHDQLFLHAVHVERVFERFDYILKYGGDQTKDVVTIAIEEIMARLSRLRNYITNGVLSVSVMHRTVPFQFEAMATIKCLNPTTISWGSSSDYMNLEDFHIMAKSCSDLNTVHYVQPVKWTEQISKSKFTDFVFDGTQRRQQLYEKAVSMTATICRAMSKGRDALVSKNPLMFFGSIIDFALLNGVLASMDGSPAVGGVSDHDPLEVWLGMFNDVAGDGVKVYLKDTGSSSGTFLNRMRLSPSGKVSRPYPLKDGDVIQLGIDYQGRPEDIYKCVIIKIGISVSSQVLKQRKRENPVRFRTALKALLSATNPFSTVTSAASTPPMTPLPPTLNPTPVMSPAPQSHLYQQQPQPAQQQQPQQQLPQFNPANIIISTPTVLVAPTPTPHSAPAVDCCICLCSIGPFQALFISPCSHCYHYKCIKNLLETNMFQCPMCRQVANLDASVSMESLFDLTEGFNVDGDNNVGDGDDGDDVSAVGINIGRMGDIDNRTEDVDSGGGAGGGEVNNNSRRFIRGRFDVGVAAGQGSSSASGSGDMKKEEKPLSEEERVDMSLGNLRLNRGNGNGDRRGSDDGMRKESREDMETSEGDVSRHGNEREEEDA